MKNFILKHWQIISIIVLCITSIILLIILITTKNERNQKIKADAAIADSVRNMSNHSVWETIGSDFADEAAKLDTTGQR